MKRESSTFVSICYRCSRCSCTTRTFAVRRHPKQNKLLLFFYHICWFMAALMQHCDECSLLTFYVKILNRELAKTQTMETSIMSAVCASWARNSSALQVPTSETNSDCSVIMQSISENRRFVSASREQTQNRCPCNSQMKSDFVCNSSLKRFQINL